MAYSYRMPEPAVSGLADALQAAQFVGGASLVRRLTPQLTEVGRLAREMAALPRFNDVNVNHAWLSESLNRSAVVSNTAVGEFLDRLRSSGLTEHATTRLSTLATELVNRNRAWKPQPLSSILSEHVGRELERRANLLQAMLAAATVALPGPDMPDGRVGRGALAIESDMLVEEELVEFVPQGTLAYAWRLMNAAERRKLKGRVAALLLATWAFADSLADERQMGTVAVLLWAAWLAIYFLYAELFDALERIERERDENEG